MTGDYMRIDVLGVGEAFDPYYANSSVVVTADGYRILIDCGATVPGLVMAKFPDPDAIDAIYFTHMHPDHIFGLVPVMLNWRDDGRSKPLHILCSPQLRSHLEQLMVLGFTGSYARVAAFARRWKADRHREQQTTGRGTFVPLHFDPGDAFQFDWCEDFAVLGGERTKLQMAHIKLSHNRAFLLRAYPLQTHEMLFDAHWHGFRIFGGVPGRGIYDIEP